MAALKGGKTLAEFAQQFDVHPNQIMECKNRLPEGAAAVFGEAKENPAAAKADVTVLHAKIGELTLENCFLVPHWRNRRPARHETWSHIDSPTIEACRWHRGRSFFGAQPPVF